jgi:hypothetical protein
MTELTSNLSIDISDWNSAIQEANDVVAKFTADSEQLIAKVAAATDNASQSANNYAENVKTSQASTATEVTKAHGSIVSSLLAWTRPAALAFGLLGMFDSKWKKYAFGLGVVAAAHKVYQASVEASAAATRAAHKAFDSAQPAKGSAQNTKSAVKLPELDQSKVKDTIGSLADLANIMGQQALFATVLYKAGLDEVGAAMVKHVSLNSSMMKALQANASALASIATTGVDMFAEGLKGSFLSIVQLTTGFTSLTDVVDYGAATLTSWSKTAQSGLDYVKDSARDAGLVFGTALAIFQSGGTLDAAAFYAEGQALNQMAEASARVIAKQEALKDALAVVNGAVTNAENERKLALDKARISQMSSVDAIDQEIQKIRQQTVATDSSITKTKEWKKYTEQLVGALEAQRTALQTGQIKEEAKPAEKSDAAKQFDQMTEALNRAKYGQEEAARMAIAASNATDEEVGALLALHDATVAATEAKKQQEKADQLLKQGADKISALRDQVDQLSGAATHAEIEMRKMARAGFTQNQIEEVGKLTAELDELQKKSKTSNERDNQANEAGSSKAAEIVLRGVGSPQKSAEQKTLTDQLATQREMLATLRASATKRTPTYENNG